MRARIYGLATAVLCAIGLAAIVGTAAARSIDLSLTLPNGARPQLTIVEGSIGSIEIGDQKFGFVPKFDEGSTSAVTVAIYDLVATPNRKLTDVRLTVGGDSVKAQTKPEITLSVPRIHGE